MADSSANHELQDLRDAIDALEAACTTSAKSRVRKVSLTVDEICEYVYQWGFQNEELTRIVEILTTKTELDQSSVTTLLKHLYPATRVPADVILAVVGALGQGGKKKPSASTQAALVRWLAAVHEDLEDHSILTKFYAVLFNLLDMITIRTPLCHLLGLITKRKHVRPFRIQRLLGLLQQAGNEPALVGLLRVYKNYCPEIIVNASGAGRPSTISQSDPEWRKRMLTIQDMSARIGGRITAQSGFKVARNGAKRTKISILPEVHTFHASETSMTIEDVEDVEHFVENLERIEPPSQLVAGLRNPLLQKFLMIDESVESVRRLEFWLSRYFEEELETLKEGFGVSPSLSELLAAAVSYTESSKTLLPVIQRFLTTYIPLWNGTSDLGAILDLLAYIHPQRFAELHRVILSHLERSILQGAHSPFDSLFECYSMLAQGWTDHLLANPKLDQIATEAYQDLVQHVSNLALSALATSEASGSAVIGFYEVVVYFARDNVTKYPQLPILGPPSQVVYLLLMSPHLSVSSRICTVIATYKQTLANKTNRTMKDAEPVNGYLMDVCNLLWRSRALEMASNDDPSAQGCLCPAELTKSFQAYLTALDRDYRIQMIFGLSFNPTMSSLSRSAFDALQDAEDTSTDEALHRHAGPVTERSLGVLGYEGGMKISWKQCRVNMLQWMDERGIAGIKGLLFATMRNLMNA
ncbi:Mis6-domain-containing protein [Tothia fuscella]|uniref:Mis6-domain-containing protein n=1 Tax=Tothia fuscella TaxID=1048955 RepID=A0A9P4U010_9PEZI|nr:Mis6-domain-containing protein [Tothia fuscella]